MWPCRLMVRTPDFQSENDSSILFRATNMNSAKLIEMIKAADPGGTRQVYLQRDPEGNGYDTCYGVWAAVIDKHGEVGMESLTEADRKAGFTDEDVKKGKKILVIQP